MKLIRTAFLAVSLPWMGNSLYAQTAAACFSSPSDNIYPASSNAQCIEKGDFNNDGKQDVVMGNFTAGTLKMFYLRGNGDGTFAAPVTFEGNPRPQDIKAFDFNNDGNLDLAVANNNSAGATFSIVMGNGNGTFQAPVSYSTNASPTDISLADLNGDGTMDLVVSNLNTGFQVYLGSTVTPGTFAGGTNFPMATGPRGIATADFNGDGFKDVATANSTANSMSVRFGDGTGSFAAAVNYPTGNGSYAIATADLNGDGVADLAVTNELGNTVSVFINPGTGLFPAAVNYPTGNAPDGMRIADMNGDAIQDLVIANSTGNSFSILRGTGSGTFLAQTETPALNTPKDLVVGNFNADSYADIAISCAIGASMPVYLGNASYTYEYGHFLPTGNSPKGIATADFNGDSDPDLVVVNSLDDQFAVYLGQVAGTFSTATTFATGALPVAVFTGDVNNDGSKDVVTANKNSDNISVFLGNGAGGFSAGAVYSAGTGPTHIKMDDLNADGNLDVVVTNSASNQISVLFGNGTGAFGAPVSYNVGTNPVALVIARLNADASKDIAVVNYGSHNVSILLNSGAGSYAAAVNYDVFSPVGTPNPSGIEVGLLNGDANLDLLITNYSSSSFLSKLINNGSGSFTRGTPSTTSDANANGLATGDFNNDGKLDVMPIFISSAASTGTAYAYMGDASGGFFGSTPRKFSAGMGPVGIVTGDFNQDGRLDAAVVNNVSESVSILLNTTAQATALGVTTFCNGGSVTLQSTPANVYSWSNGTTTQSANITASGSYTVTTTTGQSGWCSSTSLPPIVVTVTAGPSAPTITASGPLNFCTGNNVVLTSSYATGNLWSTGETTQSITVTTSGSYTVTATVGLCTSVPSAATVVTVSAITATATPGGPTSFCTGGNVTLTSNSTVGNLWSTGATSQSIVVSATGSYSVTVNAGGCPVTTSAPVAVTVSAVPATPTITAGGPTTFCAGNSVVLTSSAASGNTWSNGATSQSITVSTTGSYNVHVTTAGCSSANSANTPVTVSVTPSAPTVSVGGPTSFCAGGSVTLTSSAPSGNTWSNGATTQSITVSSSGIYSTTVTIGSCPSPASANVTVTVYPTPATPTITAGGPTTFCTGGSVVLTASAAPAYTWSTGATTQSITVSAAGSYSVTTTSANGCLSAASVATVVTVNPLPAAPTITTGGPTTFCAGGNVVLTSSAATGNTWSTGALTQSITVSAAGSYTVNYTSAGCPSAASAATVVTVNPLPAAPTITASGPLSFCAGNSVTLTSSLASGNHWSTGQTSQSIVVSASGTYTVYQTDANTCSSPLSAGTVVSVQAVPATPTITAGGPTTFCAGGNVVLTSSAASGNTWSTGATTQSITVSTAGPYTVAANVGGCSSASSAPTNITLNPIPATPTISASGPTTFCTGGSVILTSSAASGNLWSNGEFTQSITVTTSGSYSVATTSGGCSSTASAVTVVTVDLIPAAPTVTADGPLTFCAGGSVVLTSSAATGNTWSTGATTPSITVSVGGSYTVTQTSVAGCVSPASAATVVTVTAIPAPPVITAASSTVFCAGGSVVLISSAASGNTWSSGPATASITVSTAGSYTVTQTVGGCISPASAPVIVTVNPNPAAPTITAGGPLAFCIGGNVVLTSSATAGNTWSNTATSNSITVTASGSYTVTETNVATGCVSPASTATVVTVNPVPSQPTITATGTTTFCSGNGVVLTSSASSGNLWSTGESSQSIIVLTSGSYTVTQTIGSCVSPVSAPMVITVNPLPASPTISASGPTGFCDGGSVVLTSSYPSANTWSTTSTNASITVVASGTFTVVYTDGNGCTSMPSTPVSVTVGPVPSTPTISAGGPLSFCDGGNVVLTSSNATGNVWSTGATTQSITATASGTYTVSQVVGGCPSVPSNAINVTANPLPATPVITASGPTTVCHGSNVILTSSAASGNTWSTTAVSNSISVTTSGSYTVTQTAAGCTSLPSAPMVISVNALPVVTAGGPTAFCAGGNVVLTSSYATDNLWSTGETSQSITVSAAGSYFVAVSPGGCPASNSSSIPVVVHALPATPFITTGGPTTFCAGGSVVLTSSQGSGNSWSTTETSPSITVNASGSYTVAFVDGNGCASASSSPVAVNVNPLPAAPVITADGPTAFCTGDSVVLTSSETSGNTWSTGATSSSITVHTSGTYSLIFADGNTCNSAPSAGTTVTVTATPAVPTITASGSTNLCDGQQVTLTSSSASDNLWSTGETSPSIIVNAGGNYSVAVVTAGCSSAASVNTTVVVNPLPASPSIIVPGTTTFCAGGSALLISSYDANNNWSTSATNDSILANTSGTYTVTYTDANGCISLPSAGVVVTVNPLPASPVITASGPIALCTGDDVTLTSSYAGGNTWSTTEIGPSILVTTGGTYTATYTNMNGCTSPASAPVVVTVNAIPAIPTITPGGPTTFCAGDQVALTSSAASGNIWSTGETAQTIIVSASGSYKVLEMNGGCASDSSSAIVVTVDTPPAPVVTANGPTSFCTGDNVLLTSSAPTDNLWSNGLLSQSIFVTTSGTYTVSYTNPSGCVSLTSIPVVVSENPIPPAPTITASGPLSFCAGGSVVLTSSAPSGNIWSTNDPTPSITVTAAGSYTVSVTLLGCTSATSASTLVTVTPVPPVPTVTAIGPTTFCEGGSVTLTSSAATGIVWSNGSLSASIPAITTGTYTVTVTGVNGCSSTSLPQDVLVHPLPVVTFTTNAAPCNYSAAFPLTGATPAGGTYAGVGVSGGIFTPSVVGVGSSTVTYSYTNNNGCTGTASHVIVVDGCLSVDEVQQEAFSVYPNPSDGKFTIVSENAFIEQIKLYDSAGKLIHVMDTGYEQKIHLDLMDLPNGVYMAELAAGGSSQVLRLIINR